MNGDRDEERKGGRDTLMLSFLENLSSSPSVTIR